jgi:hypothetical protein
MSTSPSQPVSAAAILQLGQGFQASKTLLSAVELGLFTELARGPLDAEALRARLGLHARGARDFFDALVALGMLERQDDCYCYRNTAETDWYLDRGKPSYVGGILEMISTRSFRFWGQLTEALRTGQPQSGIQDGGDVFATIYADPAVAAGCRWRARLSAMSRASSGFFKTSRTAAARRWRRRTGPP